MRNVIGTVGAINTVAELIEALDELSGDIDTTYITIDGNPIRVVGVEETLTDGSKVRNIELQSIAPRGWR